MENTKDPIAYKAYHKFVKLNHDVNIQNIFTISMESLNHQIYTKIVTEREILLPIDV